MPGGPPEAEHSIMPTISDLQLPTQACSNMHTISGIAIPHGNYAALEVLPLAKEPLAKMFDP